MPCSGVGYGDSSTVCDIAGGKELSAPTAGVVRGHGRARGERGNGQGLTRGRERSSVGSGKPLQRRIDDGDLRAPEMKTTTLRSTAASSGRVRRVCSSTGSGRSSGMHSGSEGVAGRGVSQRSGHGGFGHERKEQGSERERAGRQGSGRGGSRGVSWHLRASRREATRQEVARGKQEVAEASRARATPRLCSSSWQRRKRTRGRRWAGPARWSWAR